ncbi:MAG: hypothetical protein ABIE94_05195 [archaeon]
MAEKKTLIDGRELKYSGLLNLREMLLMIDAWLMDHGYEREIRKNYEEVYEDGKQVTVEMTPFKKASEYAKYRMRITMVCRGLKDVEIEKGGVKTRLLKGEVHMVFDTYLETDFENAWDTRPVYYFLRMIFDKYIYKVQNKQYEKDAVRDTLELEDQIKAFLNMHRYL